MYNTGILNWRRHCGEELHYSGRLGEPDPVLAEVENSVVCAHEDVPKYPECFETIVRMQGLLLHSFHTVTEECGLVPVMQILCSAISIPERSTRRRYVECHEPTNTDGLTCLLQLHNVL